MLSIGIVEVAVGFSVKLGQKLQLFLFVDVKLRFFFGILLVLGVVHDYFAEPNHLIVATRAKLVLVLVPVWSWVEKGGCGFRVLRDLPVKELHCTQPDSRCPDDSLPDFSKELTGADNFFSSGQNALHSPQKLTVLVFQGWDHAKHKSWQTDQKLLFKFKDVFLDEFKEFALDFKRCILVEIEQA